MNIQTSKNLGILGVSLIFLDAILRRFLAINTLFMSGASISTYGIIRIIGIIFILISLHNLANFYQTKTISTNAKIGAVGAIISTMLSFLIPPIIATITTTNTVITLLLQFIIFPGFFIIAAFYVKRALNELAEHSGINDFATAGKWLFIGAILTIIVFGIIIIGVAFLMLANAFLKMKNTQPTPPPYTTEITSSPQNILTSNIVTSCYCTQCGTSILPENVFCPHCGKRTN